MGAAEPEELQRLLRLMVRKIEWMPDGEHRIQYYLPRPAVNRDWFATVVRSDTPGRIRTSNQGIMSALL